jgi:hypothetical protein
MSGNDYGQNDLSNFNMSIDVDEVIRTLRTQFEDSLTVTPVAVAGLNITLSKSITGQGGHRYWFICPSCGSRVAKLYIELSAVGCRHCQQIKYPGSRYKGMIEGQINERLQD